MAFDAAAVFGADALFGGAAADAGIGLGVADLLGDAGAAGAADLLGTGAAAGAADAGAAGLGLGAADLFGDAGALGATDAAALGAGAGGLDLLGAGLEGVGGATAGGAADLAGAAGAADAAAAVPDLALPASTLPQTPGLSAFSAASPADLSTVDPLAEWGGGSAPNFAPGADTGISPNASTPWWQSTVDPSLGAAPSSAGGSTGALPFSATPTAAPAGGGGAAGGGAAGAAAGPSTDALTAISAQPTAAATAAAPAATAVTPPAAAGGGSTLSGIGDWLKANPVLAASLGVGGGLLAKNALFPAKLPQQSNLEQIAQQAQSMVGQNQALEQRLLDPLTSGQLPAPQQAQVDQAVQDAITGIRSKYASLGMQGSSSEQDEIAAAQQKGLVLSGTLAEQMAQTGLSAGTQAAQALNISGTVYEQLMQQQIQQDTALQNAIAAFAGQAAVAGAISTRPTTAKVA